MKIGVKQATSISQSVIGFLNSWQTANVEYCTQYKTQDGREGQQNNHTHKILS